jgi:subtilase family serine protease
VRGVPSLGPGASSTGSKTVKVKNGTAPGTYFLLACADDKHVVTEDNENNNCRASAGTVVVVAPDLVETSITDPPATRAVGGSFTVTDTAQNQGNAAAGASTTRYYLSLNTKKSSGDILLTGTRAVPGLAVGASSSGSVAVTIPGGTPAAQYFVLACADDAKVVTESNEKNNCRASAATVTVTP